MTMLKAAKEHMDYFMISKSISYYRLLLMVPWYACTLSFNNIAHHLEPANFIVNKRNKC